MGFMDKAKAAADNLAAKADSALANSGLGGPGAAASPERLLRDLGVVSFWEATGRPVPEGERDRLLDALRGLEAGGSLPPLALQTTPPPAGVVPPPPGGAVPQPPPPPPGGMAPPPPAPASSGPVAPTAPPPPPPSWMNKSEDA